MYFVLFNTAKVLRKHAYLVLEELREIGFILESQPHSGFLYGSLCVTQDSFSFQRKTLTYECFWGGIRILLYAKGTPDNPENPENPDNPDNPGSNPGTTPDPNPDNGDGME